VNRNHGSGKKVVKGINIYQETTFPWEEKAKNLPWARNKKAGNDLEIIPGFSA
jgi:hypothetical protein